MCFEFHHLIVQDGGSLDHGAGNHGYGSFQLSNRDERQQVIQLDPRTATNNQAEYLVLISALVSFPGQIERETGSSLNHNVVIHTNSRLLMGQSADDWRAETHFPTRSPALP